MKFILDKLRGMVVKESLVPDPITLPGSVTATVYLYIDVVSIKNNNVVLKCKSEFNGQKSLRPTVFNMEKGSTLTLTQDFSIENG